MFYRWGEAAVDLIADIIIKEIYVLISRTLSKMVHLISQCNFYLNCQGNQSKSCSVEKSGVGGRD